MTQKDGRVVLSAWVEPVLRDHARTAAKSAGVEFSKWVARAVQRSVAEESAARAMRTAHARDECTALGAGKLLLESIWCDCDCNHDAESHDADCEQCLACRISRAIET